MKIHITRNDDVVKVLEGTPAELAEWVNLVLTPQERNVLVGEIKHATPKSAVEKLPLETPNLSTFRYRTDAILKLLDVYGELTVDSIWEKLMVAPRSLHLVTTQEKIKQTLHSLYASGKVISCGDHWDITGYGLRALAVAPRVKD